MLRYLVAVGCLCLFGVAARGQSTTITEVLQDIARHNRALQAYAIRIEGQQLALQAENNLPDPQFGAYYLPIGAHDTGDYTEFQVTQTAEFPTVYRARREWLASQAEQLQLSYDSLRHSILLPAQLHCIELVHLNQRWAVGQERLEQARRVYEQLQDLYEAEQVGILEANKAKVAWLQARSVVDRIEQERQDVRLALQHLNGGMPISIEQTVFTDSLPLPDLANIWSEKQAGDPVMALLRQRETTAMRRMELTRQQRLPNLTAGLNYQGVAGANYAGLFAGVSIPLWSPRHRLAAAESAFTFQQTQREARLAAAYSELERSYRSYQQLLERYQEYQRTLQDLNSEDLLLQAYELGQISFVEYYLELQFYREAYDHMLDMDRDLRRLRATILQHQL
ncbi:MAG: TolC family protein [Lewinella sp.]|nr:TolC family protein [Lewinella sp.]